MKKSSRDIARSFVYHYPYFEFETCVNGFTLLILKYHVKTHHLDIIYNSIKDCPTFHRELNFYVHISELFFKND